MHASLFLIGMLLVGCGDDPAPALDAAPSPDGSTAPALSVTATPSTLMRGEMMQVSVTPSNFMFVDPRSSPPPQPGQGHYHYYVDAETQYTAAWDRQFTIYTSTVNPPGEHVLRFVLVANDHTEIEPRIETSVTYTLQ